MTKEVRTMLTATALAARGKAANFAADSDQCIKYVQAAAEIEQAIILDEIKEELHKLREISVRNAEPEALKK